MNPRRDVATTMLSLLCAGLFALSLSGCAEGYYADAYYTYDRTYYPTTYGAYYTPDYGYYDSPYSYYGYNYY